MVIMAIVFPIITIQSISFFYCVLGRVLLGGGGGGFSREGLSQNDN